MEYRNFFALLGGLALFLYGMHQMSEGLNAAAGEKMKQILERLTKNRFLGVGVGAAVTAVIQSSSATTVMVVGFVNSGMMTLRQAVWIIMGGEYRHHNHRSADCTGCGSRCAASGFLGGGPDSVCGKRPDPVHRRDCGGAWNPVYRHGYDGGSHAAAL